MSNGGISVTLFGLVTMGQLPVAGSYILTATSATRPAHAPPGDRHTAFTGALIDALTEGHPGGGDLLTLDRTFTVLRTRLAERALPRPEQLGTDTIANLALTRNAAHRPA